MLVRKYVIGENELRDFGDVIKGILDASLIESCRTKASDLIRILKRVDMGGTLQPDIYDVKPNQIEEIRQGHLDALKDENGELNKGLVIILDENDYVMYIDSRAYDVLVSKGDVYSNSDEIQNSLYIDALTGKLMYASTVDASTLLVGYGVLDDMVHGQTRGVVSVAGMYASRDGYKCSGPVYFPEHSDELKDGTQLTFDTHENCPFCGEPITVSKHDVEVCKNIACIGRKVFGLYSIIAPGELPDAGILRAMRALIEHGHDTIDKIGEFSPKVIGEVIQDSDDNAAVFYGMQTILTKVQRYKWNQAENEELFKNYCSKDDKPLKGVKIFVMGSGLSGLTGNLKILGADIECYIDKITEEHLILASVPEDLAELADELHDCSSIKSFKAINISDCKTTVDIAEKIINRNAIIEIAVF